MVKENHSIGTEYEEKTMVLFNGKLRITISKIFKKEVENERHKTIPETDKKE